MKTVQIIVTAVVFLLATHAVSAQDKTGNNKN